MIKNIKKRMSVFLYKVYSIVEKLSVLFALICPVVLLYCCYKIFKYHIYASICGLNIQSEYIYLYYVIVLMVNVIIAILLINPKDGDGHGIVFIYGLFFTVFCLSFLGEIKLVCEDIVITADSVRTCTIVTDKGRKPARVYYEYTVTGKKYKSEYKVGDKFDDVNVGDTIIIEYSARYNHLSRVVDFTSSKVN